jgi:hypothetical protein
MKPLREIVGLREEIKGWKNAHSDIMKMRRAQSNDAKEFTVHQLKKDGTPSGMHDAKKKFGSEEEAHKHIKYMRELNPTRNLRYHLNGTEV